MVNMLNIHLLELELLNIQTVKKEELANMLKNVFLKPKVTSSVIRKRLLTRLAKHHGNYFVL